MLCVAKNTANLRLRELRKALTQIAVEELPWGSNINEKNVAHQVPFILKQLEFKSRRENKEQNTDKDMMFKDNKEINLLGTPPSFFKNEQRRERRRRKLKKAKQRIQGLVSCDPTAAKTLAHIGKPTISIEDISSTKNIESNQFDKNKQLDEDTDEEDLIIEKLLLQNVEEDLIIEGHYESLQKEFEVIPQDIKRKGNQIEADEKDISDEEILEFIRTPAEVKILEELEEEKRKLKKKKIS